MTCPPLDAQAVIWRVPLAMVGWVVAARVRESGRKGVGRKVDWASVFALIRARAEA